MSNIINISDLAVGYGKKIIINGVETSIPKGKITSIIGPNGCGKSTLIKTIGKILKRENGSILLEGKEISKIEGKEVAKRLAFLAQITTSPEGLKIRDLVAYGRFPYQKPFSSLTEEDYKYIDWALNVTNLKHIENSKVDSLSGGQRQRVWIAMALAQGTDTIILDEPTTYLDIMHQLEVLNLLKRLNEEENKTIIMVLHDINQAASYSHNIIAMKEGNIIAEGTPKEVITRENLKVIYGINADIMTYKDKITCVHCEVCDICDSCEMCGAVEK
ncbi:ABC transporter ATP-binding protein [Clostridium sp.]|uniref:ABC transporter ATP-binding protein n=1 Tax=Clostridium sp. TaxID=1506 RepID=UPI003463F74C